MTRVPGSRGSVGAHGGQDPDAFLRRGLDRLGAQAGAPDTADLRTAVMARAKRDRAVQRLATSAALFLPVALAVWTAAALGNRDITGGLANFGNSPDDPALATATATTTVKPGPVAPSGRAAALPSATSGPQPPVASPRPSVVATSPVVAATPHVTSAGRPASVEMAITKQVSTQTGYLLTYHVSWSGAPAPAVRVDLLQGDTVLRSTPRKVECSVAGHGGVVTGTVAVIGPGPVVFQAIVYTQACGGSQSAGARTLTWNADVPTLPTTSPSPVPTATSPAPTPSVDPTVTPSGTPSPQEQPTVLPGASPGGLMSPPLPEQATPVPTASPDASGPASASPGVTAARAAVRDSR